MSQRAILYLRQSDSDGQGERSLSLDSQSRVLRADAARFGWSVIDEIRDPDLKGYDERRPGLLHLYERCRQRDVHVVAFWRLDRLARLLRLQENILHEFTQLGVQVYSSQDPNIDHPLFRQILGAANEHLTRVISANVRSALHERARRGMPHGVPPLGYRRTSRGSNYEIVPEEAAIIQHVYQRRVEGAGDAQIARELADRGAITRNGSTAWTISTIAAIRTRATYRGTATFGTTSVDNCIPPIIDHDVWERAQEPRPSNRRAHRPKPIESFLEGLIEHECGSPMYLIQVCPQTPRPRFRCRLASAGALFPQQQKCPYSPRSGNMETLEQLVWEQLVIDLDRVLDPARVIAEARKEYAAQAPAGRALHRDATARLQRAKDRRKRAEDLYLSGSRDRAWFDAEDARAMAELEAAEQIIAQVPRPPDRDAIKLTWDELGTLRKWLPSVTSPEAKALALRSAGVAVVTKGDRRVAQGWAAAVRIRYRTEFALFLPNHVT
ncbi:MAG: recombinase family protein [Thermomicrobiales bacterium]